MRGILLIVLFVVNLYSSVLFLGGEENSFECDKELSKPISVKNCKEIKALSDLNICYFKGVSLGCKKLFKGEVFKDENYNSSNLSFDRLLSFKSNNTTTFGIKRFGDVADESGIPLGSILKPSKNVKIKFDKKHKIDFQLYRNQKLVKEIKNSNNSITLNKKLFHYGKEYKWKIKLDNDLYEGEFDVVPLEVKKEVDKEIKNAVGSIKDEQTLTYIKSIVYDQYGLTFNRKLILIGEKK